MTRSIQFRIDFVCGRADILGPDFNFLPRFFREIHAPSQTLVFPYIFLFFDSVCEILRCLIDI